jgi:uncharacterized protein YukE
MDVGYLLSLVWNRLGNQASPMPNLARSLSVLSAMQAELQKLIQRWRKDADQYSAQVEEARRAGTPYDQMLSGATFLRQCAKELEAISQSKKVEEGPHAAQRK